MAAVTGRTSISIDQLINDTIVDGEVVSGHLILRSRGGAEIDAGVLDTSIDILTTMPVGFIYMSVDATSPAVLFGAGTWQRIGQGRVLIGQDQTQAEFINAEATGGEKTHTLTSSELPSHSHSVNHDHPSATTSSDNNHTHTLERKTTTGTSTGVARGGATASADGTTNAAVAHSHTLDVPAFTGTSGTAGTGLPHNIIQPYLVVFMWKRVA